MKHYSLVASLLLCASALASAFEVDLEKGGAPWKLNGLSAEVAGGALRLREIGERKHGTAKIRVPVKGARYLQIVAGASENPQHYMTVGNVSAPGMPRGYLFQGCNTFPLPDGNFTLALTLFGPRGTTPGGWYDVKAVRTVEVPLDGVCVTSKKPVVKVGDSFRVEYTALPGGARPAALPLQVYFGSSMAPVTFGDPVVLHDDGEAGDRKAGDGVYSAVVAVTEKASRLQDVKGGPLPGGELCFAVRLPNGAASQGVAAFAFDVATKNPIWGAGTLRMTPTTAEYHARWERAVSGKVNLAHGRPVEFSVQPNFKLTVGKNNTDQLDLTDGRLSARGDDLLRVDSGAVGWRTGEDLSNGIDMLVDLGKVEPVDKVVIRINCGDKQRQIQRSPRSLAVLVSKDGERYYPAAPPMIKLEPGEKDQSDFKGQYYLEENDDTIFCYPFELPVQANARYVMVRIVPDGGNLYTDELAILKADALPNGGDAAYNGTPERRLTEGYLLTPAFNGDFFIADNLPAPNYFKFRDLNRDLNRVKAPKALKMVVELPEGIVCRNAEAASEAFVRDGGKYTRFTLAVPSDPSARAHQMEHLPFFFQAERNLKVAGKACFYVTADGKPSHVTERTIRVLTLPEAPRRFRGLTVLSRMQIGDSAWPGYLDNLRKLGFSGAQIYPYLPLRGGAEQFPPEYCAAVEAARQAGYQIVMGFNGLKEMYHPANHPSEEVWCQTDSPRHNTCPSFRGREYQAELAKITRCVAVFKPACIQWDIEHWGRALPGMRTCARCLAGWKQSGKSWEAYLDDLSVELNRDLTEAVAKGARQAAIPMPAIYNYNRQALSRSYHGFEKWALNHQFVTGSQPSLYVAGNELRVHNSIRGNYDLQPDKGRRVIAPVLTPNTYGAYEPYHLEQMIYETMLNGAAGFFYYPWRGFVSPVYFYYHARAMQNVIRHQDLILDGEVFTPQCSQPKMTVSGVRNGDEALVLVGNYLGAQETCAVQAPFDQAAVTDVLTGKALAPADLKELQVPRHRVRLLHWRRK